MKFDPFLTFQSICAWLIRHSFGKSDEEKFEIKIEFRKMDRFHKETSLSDGKTRYKLISKVLKSLNAKLIFRDTISKVNAMDFSRNGELLISCNSNDEIIIHDCNKGVEKQKIPSLKYGADLVHFTSDSDKVIFSSTKTDNSIRYLNIERNDFIKYYRGHEDMVVSLCVSPLDKRFISGGADGKLFLWDLRSEYAVGEMSVKGKPIAAFDPEGLIFAIGLFSDRIKLYDARSYKKGPFKTFQFNQDVNCDLTGLKFSPNGKSILINTNGSYSRLIDAFEGQILHSFHSEYYVRD